MDAYNGSSKENLVDSQAWMEEVLKDPSPSQQIITMMKPVHSGVYNPNGLFQSWFYKWPG